MSDDSLELEFGEQLKFQVLEDKMWSEKYISSEIQNGENRIIYEGGLMQDPFIGMFGSYDCEKNETKLKVQFIFF